MGTIERLPGNEQAIKQLNERLAQLKVASEIEVVDQTTFISSAATKLDFENYIRAVEDHFEPELAPAEETVKRVKLQISMFVTPVKQWLVALNNRRREWAADERKAAQDEQDKINEKARQEARAAHGKTPAPVTVKPNVPAVPGTRNTINWRYRILDVNAIPEEYWMLNEQKLREEVKREKEKTNIPGIEAYPE